MKTTNNNNKIIYNPFETRDYQTEILDSQYIPHAHMQIEVTETDQTSKDARETVQQEQHVSKAFGSNALDIQDAVATVKSVTKHKHVDSKILHTSDDGLLPTIKNYLAKPCIVSSGTLTTGDLPSSFTKYATTYP